MIAQGMPIYIALERVDLRFGSERLGAWVREHLAMDPGSRALFVFVGKRGETMRIPTCGCAQPAWAELIALSCWR